MSFRLIMAVGSIFGALGYLRLGLEAMINKRSLIETCGAAIPTPFVSMTVAIKLSIIPPKFLS